jgi:hypothetical protein
MFHHASPYSQFSPTRGPQGNPGGEVHGEPSAGTVSGHTGLHESTPASDGALASRMAPSGSSPVEMPWQPNEVEAMQRVRAKPNLIFLT